MANIKISELNELTQKANNDYVPIVDTSADETKKISVKDLIPSNVTLLAVSSVEPEECYTGDKYFNTTTNLIYTAIERNVWSTTGELAQMGINYIVFDTQTAYAYDGTTLVSVGGGSGGGETLPVGSTIEYTGTVQDIPDGWEEVNDYSTTEIDTGKKWIDGSIIYRKVISVNNQRVASDETIPHGISNMGTLISIKGTFYDGSVYREYPTVNVSAEPQLLNCGANSTSITFYGNVSWGASATRTHTFVLEYTKSS